jgi:hypothetical protein
MIASLTAAWPRELLASVTAARPRDLLGIYLNDHLAGAVAGSELARRCQRNNAGTRYAEPLRGIANAIAEDRRTLEHLTSALGVAGNPAKQLSALAAERISRLKLNGRLTGYSPLSRIVEFDSLSAGINGKRALWMTLLRVADHFASRETRGGASAEPRPAQYEALRAEELQRLISRADEQLETIQRLRDQASVEAFVET